MSSKLGFIQNRWYYKILNTNWLNLGSGALSDKMLLVRIVENHKIDDYLGHVRLIKR